MILDEQLKTIYNSNTRDSLALTFYWYKFKKWIRDVVLHSNSNKKKLLKEFTTVQKKMNEDLNEFYL
jgi:hypothetical protein